MTRLQHSAPLTTLTGLVFGLLLVAPAIGDEAKLPMWRIDGDSNRVYLLGSVHLLRQSDYPLPAGIYDAYADAEALVMELDMDDLDTAAAQSLASELGLAAAGSSLAALLGAESYAQAVTLAAEASIPLELLAQTEPWLAAITIEQLMLTRIGFDPAFGVENHFMERAISDAKEIHGLETMREQLELLDGLPADVQRALLMQTLEEGLEIQAQMDMLIAAWRDGDIATLEENILGDMQAQPVLYEKLVVARNKNWVNQIELFLEESDDYLIIVGALHLVGEDGVPELLRQRGHAATQIAQPAIR